MADVSKHPFRQHGAKTRSFCQDCGQPSTYEGHPGGTEPLKSRAAATMTVEDNPSHVAKKKPAKKRAKRA